MSKNRAVIEKKMKKKFKGKERNLFLVSTAFQLINAIEAQKYFKTKNNILVLFYFGNINRDHEQLEEIVELFDYNQLITFKVEPQKKYLNLIIDLLKVLQKNQYKKVFTGYFSANLRRFIANVKYQELFLIDDGVYTISIHNELYAKDTKRYKKYITEYSEKKRTKPIARLKFYIYRQFRKFYLKIHGFQNDMKEMPLNFYTIFNLPQYQNEIIVKNNYKYICKYFLENNIEKKCSNPNKNIVYFLGQPLNRVFNIDDRTYISYIKYIINYYKNKEIVYIPHRAEKEKIIENIENIKGNIKVKKIFSPFELYILRENIKVTHIASFLSTTLFSIKQMYSDVKVDAFRLKINSELDNNNALIYKMLEQNNTNIIFLEGNK
jgi:hypothetical protein